MRRQKHLHSTGCRVYIVRGENREITMWTCSECSTEVEDQFDSCPICGTGRDGSEPPVDFVRKKDAFQPGMPVRSADSKRNNRLISIIVVVAAILALLWIAFSK